MSGGQYPSTFATSFDPYHSSSTRNMGPSSPYARKCHTTETTIAHLFHHLETIFEGGHWCVGCSPGGRVICDCHGCVCLLDLPADKEYTERELVSGLEYSWNVTSGLHSLLVKRGVQIEFPAVFQRERGRKSIDVNAHHPNMEVDCVEQGGFSHLMTLDAGLLDAK